MTNCNETLSQSYTDRGEVETGVPFTRYSLHRFTTRTLHFASHLVQSATIERLNRYNMRSVKAQCLKLTVVDRRGMPELCL